MKLSIEFDRTSATLRAFTTLAHTQINVDSLKGALCVAAAPGRIPLIPRDRSEQSIRIHADILGLVHQWLASMLSLADTDGSQHTFFCEGGGVVLERYGSSLQITFDPSLDLQRDNAMPAEVKRSLKVSYSQAARATLRATGEFCAQVLAINSALELHKSVQQIRTLRNELKNRLERDHGLLGILTRLRGATASFDNPWKWVAGVAVVVLLWQVRSFSHRLSQLQSQLVAAQSASTQSSADDKADSKSKSSEKKAEDSKKSAKTEKQPGSVTIGIPGAESNDGKAGDPSVAQRNQARKTRDAERAGPDSALRNSLPPLPALLPATPNAPPNNDTRWKLAGIVEFNGEKSVLLDPGGNPQQKITVHKKTGETVDPGGWRIAEIQADRVLLTRKKQVGGKAAAGAVERMLLTIGQ